MTDSCPDYSCFSMDCSWCSFMEGPGAGGCYRDPGLAGVCAWQWSSSVYVGEFNTSPWSVAFYDGEVIYNNREDELNARCVHRER